MSLPESFRPMAITAPAFPELSREQLEALCLKQNGRVIALVAALKLALPYAQRVAATAPTEPARMQRQIQARRDVDAIQVAIANVEGR